MNHSPSNILNRLHVAYLCVSALILSATIAFQLLDLSDTIRDFWGLTIPIAIIAGFHLAYGAVYGLIRRRNPYLAALLSHIIFAILVATLIETSGNINLAYRFGWVFVVGISAVFGWIVVLAEIALATILTLFDMLGYFAYEGLPNSAEMTLNLLVIISGLGGWWILRRTYTTADTNDIEQLNSSLKQKQSESALIIQSIADGVLLLDNQKIIRTMNSAASSMTSWTIGEAEGLDYRSVIKFVDEKDEPYDASTDPIARAYNEGTIIRDNNAFLVSRNEHRIAVSLSVSPILNEQNDVTGIVAVLRDVSQERKEQEQRADFISTASHEMRTPVAAIEGYLSLALNEKVSTVDSRAHGYLTKAYTSTRHLGELFQDLLTSAKAEDGRLTNNPTPTELGELLESLTEDLRFTAQKKNLSMQFVIGASNTIDTSTKVVRPLYYANVDPDRIREVVTNLFDNACKYTENGKIALGITGNESVVQIYVKDTGHGIPAEDVPHLFQKFYRVDNSATRTIGGTGLGLFICRKIIELYEGRIWVDSELGKGSTFYINVPRLTTEQAITIQRRQDTANL